MSPWFLFGRNSPAKIHTSIKSGTWLSGFKAGCQHPQPIVIKIPVSAVLNSLIARLEDEQDLGALASALRGLGLGRVRYFLLQTDHTTVPTFIETKRARVFCAFSRQASRSPTTAKGAVGRRVLRPSFFGGRWCAKPSDDCIQAWPELLFQFCSQLDFYPTSLTDRRPVDMAIQKRGRFPADDQTGQIRPYVLQHSSGCDWSDTQFAEFRNFSLKMT